MEAIQQILVVAFVLGLLGFSLYWMRGKGLARFNGKSLARGAERRMQTLERLPLTAQHSLHLVKVDGRTLVIAVSPGGCSVIETEDRLVAQ